MNEVFTIREGEWNVRCAGRVLPTVWNSRGAALAGLATELRRAQARSLICGIGRLPMADASAVAAPAAWAGRFDA
jgi:hypothetical protein